MELVLDRLLRATTKKGRQLFGRKKVQPRQNPGYAYDTSCPSVNNKTSAVLCMISDQMN